MKRALAICAAVFAFGAFGFGIGLSGEWTTTLNILPEVGLDESTLELTYTIAGWDITSTSTFGAAGFTSQAFALSGALGFADVTGSMEFDPTGPSYTESELDISLDFLGVELGFNVAHVPYELDYTITAGMDPFGLEVVFIERHHEYEVMDMAEQTESITMNTISFDSLTFTADDIELCCGVTFDFELSFLKSGFDYAMFTFANLFTIMDMWSFDISITYGVDYKSVGVEIDFDFPAMVCVRAIVDSTGLFDLTLHGFSITCVLADCNSILFGTLIEVTETATVSEIEFEDETTYYYERPVWSRKSPTGWGLTDGSYGFAYGVVAEEVNTTVLVTDDETDYDQAVTDAGDDLVNAFIFPEYRWIEYEVIKLSFCGPACCGGEYDVDIALYWADFYQFDEFADATDPFDEATPDEFTYESIDPTLFGLSRMAFDASVPVMENFTAELGFAYTLLSGMTELTFGWTFTF